MAEQEHGHGGDEHQRHVQVPGLLPDQAGAGGAWSRQGYYSLFTDMLGRDSLGYRHVYIHVG